MPHSETPLIVLAGLLHDTGKLFERAGIFNEARQDETYLGFCPTDHKGGWKTHLHAAHTRAFCDWLEQRFDCLRNLADRSWKDWCAGHHRHDERALEATVIREADRLSASEREEGEYYARDIHRRTLLEPVLERIWLGSDREGLATRCRYPLTRLSVEKGHCFPSEGSQLGLEVLENAADGVDDPKSWKHLLSPTSLTNEYRQLAENLLEEIEAVSSQCPDMDLAALLVTLASLFEKYTATVPSATNVRHPDISLFDHTRSTAAIAQALYLHKVHGPASTSKEPAWLLVCGDFSGIQKFIYNLTNRGAAKGLRGRSFFVQLFCRVCADHFLRELGLTRDGLLYNSGGKFYLLIPPHLKPKLLEARAQINGFLLERYGGNVSLGLGLARVTADMFEKGRMDSAWKEAAEDLERDRTNCFKELFTRDFFEPEKDFDPSHSCPVCGSRRLNDDEGSCGSCKKLENLGIWLKDTETLLFVRENASKPKGYPFHRVLSFEELKTNIFFIPRDGLDALRTLGKFDGECIFLNERGTEHLSSLPLPNCAISTMTIGKWEAGRQVNEEGEPWDFKDFAHHAKGLKRLGILRMDVDNLGEIFINGLKFARRHPIKVDGKNKEGWGDVIRETDNRVKRESMASISRMVTLSRQLNHFFSGYVPWILEKEEFNRCQIIYAGGDDLFVIGSWDQLPPLAQFIRREFQDFCCGNPAFTISGGMTLQREKYPLYKGSQRAGLAEKEAKEVRKAWGKAPGGLEKSAFCFLGIPVTWEDMEAAEVIRELLEEEQADNRGLAAYLAQVTATNKVLVQAISGRKGLPPAKAWQEIAYGPWRWRTAYQLKRRYGDKKEKIEKWSQILFAGELDKRKTILPVHSWLELPLRWADYLQRDKKQKGEK